ncbi:aldose 1-epimerase family protein [Hufsiella ginkgonis]|uniref:Aldose 1-epimerase family protein n=1 Tax=Hufsiella ginkgonis TaxID=2695274 RepID=A0A7K1Y527_9SPHI|nr:aldose 1-epimerase family protein [Hufsiella ginkgonis]MXV17927.1 aldose 1-epimerase family protein [Hufsiella ginkgonis]
MITLENDSLKVSISPEGAQLTSIFNKKDETEHLWQADPAVWGWHAPNLFPLVGESMDQKILVDGAEYKMNRHGFARNAMFGLVDATSVHAKFSLPFSEETLAVYPYRFEFQVLYDLIDNKLRVSYKVINMDQDTIYFGVGAHPAFSVPFDEGASYEDYFIEFEHAEELNTAGITNEGYFSGETKPVSLDGNKLHLTRDLFADDALVFKNIRSRKATIKSKVSDKQVSVSFPHFNYLGLWAKPGAPFVCIEPWLGCADTAGERKELRDRECIQQVAHGHVFETDFTIGIS